MAYVSLHDALSELSNSLPSALWSLELSVTSKIASGASPTGSSFPSASPIDPDKKTKKEFGDRQQS